VTVPPKKSLEQVRHEQEVLRDGFQSRFWSVLRASVEAERQARYSLLPSIESLDNLRRIQGEILAFEQILGFEVPYKPK